MRQLRFKHKPYLRLAGAGGPENRTNILKTLITALVKYERIELGYRKAFETQKYAERLISVAKRGDRDQEAMKIADFWLKDKKQIHKLFKVLGPRFEETNKNFTHLYRVPGFHEDTGRKLAFLEYAGNPYPSLTGEPKRNPDWILNVLVQGAVQELKNSKVLEELEIISQADKQYNDSLDSMLHTTDMTSIKSMVKSEGEARGKPAQQSTPKSVRRAGMDEGTPV